MIVDLLLVFTSVCSLLCRYLRSTVYNVLTTWMKVLDGCSGIVTEESNLIKQILYDCTPFTETLQVGDCFS